MEDVVHGVFLLLGLVTVGCVLLITVYLILSGLPAITKIGLGKFLFGTEWASTAADPKYGILPFISPAFMAPAAQSCSACPSDS